jgi:hypothetical protein
MCLPPSRLRKETDPISEMLDFVLYTTVDEGARCSVVVKALRYKPESCGFETR